MATLYISYWGHVDKQVAGRPISTETVTTSTSSAVSGAIPGDAVVASVYAAVDHYLTLGTGTPTATATNGFYLPAYVMRDLRVNLTNDATRKLISAQPNSVMSARPTGSRRQRMPSISRTWLTPSTPTRN